MKHAKNGRIGNTEGNTTPGGMIGLQQACSIKERFSYIHNSPWYWDSEFSMGRNVYGIHISNNGKYIYVISGNYIHRRPLSTPFDVSTAGSEDQSFYIDDYGEGIGYSIEFSPDGTTFLVGGRESSTVFQFHCTVPWSIDSTEIRFANRRMVDITNESQPRAIEMNSDGTKMYIAGYADKIVQCTLSTAYDPESKSAESNITLSSDNHTTITDIRGIAWKSDGTKFYVLSDGLNDILEYTVSTAWDLTSTVTFSYEHNVYSQTSYPSGLEFKPDGSRFWITGSGNIYQYDLSTDWDLSTLSYDTYENVSGVSNINGLTFNDNGTQAVIVTTGSNNDRLYFYSLNTAWDILGTKTLLWYQTIAYNSSGPWNNYTGYNSATRNEMIYDPSDVHLTDDYLFVTNGDYSYLGVHRFDLLESNEVRSLNNGTLLFPSTSHHSSANEPYSSYRYTTATKWSGDGRYLMVLDLGIDYVLHYQTNYPFIVSRTTDTDHGMKYLGYTDVDYIETSPWDMYMSPNGTTFAVAGTGEDVFGGFNLNTPYQPLNGKPGTGKYFHHDYAGVDDSYPTIIQFSSDGMYMYTGGYNSDKIFQYKVNQ